MELLRKAVPFAMLAFVLCSMLAMGLGLTVRQIVTPLRDYSLMARALLANFVLIPLAAVALGRLLRLDEPQAVGLLLLGAAAGAPFLPKLAQLARGEIGFAVGLMVLLMVITIGYLPLVLPFMLPGVSVNSWAIARSLLLLMLLPLGLALGVNAWSPAIAARVKPVLDRLSSLSLILLFMLLVVANFTNVLAVLGTGGILAGLLFLAAGLGTGWVLGGPARHTRQVLALGTAQRNIAAALVVAGQAFSDPNVVVMVVVVAIVGLVVLMAAARVIGRGTAEQSRAVPQA
jgi:BASS family bile acid:Na+ symporter